LGSIKFWFWDLYPCFTKLEQIPLMFLCISCSTFLYMSSCVPNSLLCWWNFLMVLEWCQGLNEVWLAHGLCCDYALLECPGVWLSYGANVVASCHHGYHQMGFLSFSLLRRLDWKLINGLCRYPFGGGNVKKSS
jgi:hypothetical protein